MNAMCLLTCACLAAATAGHSVAQPARAAPNAAPAPAPAHQEHWQYHEKWLKALERSTQDGGGAHRPAGECRPKPPGGPSAALAPAGKCPDSAVRVRT